MCCAPIRRHVFSQRMKCRRGHAPSALPPANLCPCCKKFKMLCLFETLRKKNHLVPNHFGTLFVVQILKTNLGRKQMRSKTAAIRPMHWKIRYKSMQNLFAKLQSMCKTGIWAWCIGIQDKLRAYNVSTLDVKIIFFFLSDLIIKHAIFDRTIFAQGWTQSCADFFLCFIKEIGRDTWGNHNAHIMS